MCVLLLMLLCPGVTKEVTGQDRKRDKKREKYHKIIKGLSIVREKTLG